MTKKFIEGVQLYRDIWPGSVKIYIEKALYLDDNLDHIEINKEFGIDLTIIDFDHIKSALAKCSHGSIVLCATDYRQNHISKLCKHLGIPCVITTEYTLQTRLQIVKATRKNILKRWRSYWWEFFQEKKNIKAIKHATSLQTNGLPTYYTYKNISQNVLLYFDTRVYENQVITKSELDDRLGTLSRERPLRLLFSGRLNAIKGVDHLLQFAFHLKTIGTKFHLTICGDGELKSQLKNMISRNGLSQQVSIMGVLDFYTELLPLAKGNTDLFVCCHRQGDPSCTYLETMSCGVPIIGYDNEAWQNLCQFSESGWTIPMNNYKQLAEKVAEISSNRKELIIHSMNAREFALQHTFEKTFTNRVRHLELFSKMQKPT